MANAIDVNWAIPTSFYFQVTIGGDEIAFKEVSGLSTEMELETIQEGGVNEYEHRLPKQIKHGNLVLKRALMPVSNNTVIEWISKILNEGSFFDVTGRTFPLTRTIHISLLSVDKEGFRIGGIEIGMKDKAIPVYKWECANAIPVKWEVDTLDAEKNSVLIESLEFAYSTLKRLDK
jgi:phage tail-like protein